jgi:hypothetical protein
MKNALPDRGEGILRVPLGSRPWLFPRVVARALTATSATRRRPPTEAAPPPVGRPAQGVEPPSRPPLALMASERRRAARASLAAPSGMRSRSSLGEMIGPGARVPNAGPNIGRSRNPDANPASPVRRRDRARTVSGQPASPGLARRPGAVAATIAPPGARRRVRRHREQSVEERPVRHQDRGIVLPRRAWPAGVRPRRPPVELAPALAPDARPEQSPVRRTPAAARRVTRAGRTSGAGRRDRRAPAVARRVGRPGQT